MKTNGNANPQRNEDGNQESGAGSAKAQTVDQWWEGLLPAERQFLYELNSIVRGMRESGFAETTTTTGVENEKAKLRAAFQRLAVAYDSAGVQSPGGGPDRWRWN